MGFGAGNDSDGAVGGGRRGVVARRFAAPITPAARPLRGRIESPAGAPAPVRCASARQTEDLAGAERAFLGGEPGNHRRGQALLSLNLMSAFFQGDFLAAFATRLDATAGWIGVLQRLAIDGLREGFQNRMPLT